MAASEFENTFVRDQIEDILKRADTGFLDGKQSPPQEDPHKEANLVFLYHEASQLMNEAVEVFKQIPEFREEVFNDFLSYQATPPKNTPDKKVYTFYVKNVKYEVSYANARIYEQERVRDDEYLDLTKNGLEKISLHTYDYRDGRKSGQIIYSDNPDRGFRENRFAGNGPAIDEARRLIIELRSYS